MMFGSDHDMKQAVDTEEAKPAIAEAEFVQAVHQEHELTFSKALKIYPKAIGWSAYVSLGVIMLAFDPQLMGNLYATPEFARQFGSKHQGQVGSNSKRLAAGSFTRKIY